MWYDRGRLPSGLNMAASSSSSTVLLSKEELTSLFGWEEYVVLGLMLGASAAIGVYFWWRGEKTNADFLLAKRKMGVAPMAMSLLARLDTCFILVPQPILEPSTSRAIQRLYVHH